MITLVNTRVGLTVLVNEQTIGHLPVSLRFSTWSVGRHSVELISDALPFDVDVKEFLFIPIINSSHPSCSRASCDDARCTRSGASEAGKLPWGLLWAWRSWKNKSNLSPVPARCYAWHACGSRCIRGSHRRGRATNAYWPDNDR